MFLDNYLAIVGLGVLTVITVILFGVGSQGFTIWDGTSFLQQFCLICSLALAALVSARTGGLDLSVGRMMALSASLIAIHTSEGNVVFGVLLALVVCCAVGLMNGLFVMVFRMPAIFVTVASAMLIHGITLWAGGGAHVTLPAEWVERGSETAVTALVLSLGIAVFLLWKTGGFARERIASRGQKRLFWIYGLIGVIGMLTGWAAAICFGTADAEIGSGSSNEMVLLFIFAATSASGLFKSNRVALGVTLLLAALWTMHDQAMILLQLNPFSMIVSNASWVFIFLSVLCVAKRSWKDTANTISF